MLAKFIAKYTNTHKSEIFTSKASSGIIC